MSVNLRRVGRRGEDIAASYLGLQEFEILERNFTVRGGEVDIIAPL
jgi:putative endonuclease